MRFEDLARQLDERAKAQQSQWGQDAPRREAEEALWAAGQRRYLIGHNHVVELDVALLVRQMARGLSRADATAHAIGIRIADWKTYGPDERTPTGFSSTSLWLAASIAAHIERWVAGEIAELAPSGTWVAP